MSNMETSTKNKGRSKSEEKRQQILTAAADLFLEQGFENTSMAKVAIKAGVSKQTVYSHFGNKEDLFSAIIENKCMLHSLTYDLFDLELDVQLVLRNLAVHYCELIYSDAAIRLKRVCTAETAQRNNISKLFWEAGPQQLTTRLEHYLSEQNKRGTLNIANTHFAAQQFLYMLAAEAHELKLFDQPDNRNIQELPDYIDSCVSLFIRAYTF